MSILLAMVAVFSLNSVNAKDYAPGWAGNTVELASEQLDEGVFAYTVKPSLRGLVDGHLIETLASFKKPMPFTCNAELKCSAIRERRTA